MQLVPPSGDEQMTIFLELGLHGEGLAHPFTTYQILARAAVRRLEASATQDELVPP